MGSAHEDDLICEIAPANPLISCANGYRVSFGTTMHGGGLQAARVALGERAR
jgi:hypothetical protein